MAMNERKPLPMRADLMGRKLLGMVLPRTSELRADTGLSPDQAKRGVRDLKKAALVDSAEVGCLLPGAHRAWLTDKGLDYFGASDEERSWHEHDGLGNLLIYDLPKVEAAHSIAPRYATGDWTLAKIHRYERLPMAAAAEYHRPGEYHPAYVPFCWASMMDTQSELYHRLAALPAAMMKQSLGPDGRSFEPARLAIMAADEWAATRALTMAVAVLGWWLPTSHIAAWFYSNDGWHVSDGLSLQTGEPPMKIPPLLPSTQFLGPATSERKLGTQRFDRIIDRSYWAGRGGRKLLELLTKLGEYPVGSIGHYKALVGEGPEGTETEVRLANVVERGLAEIVTRNYRVRVYRLPRGVPATVSDRGQGAHRYALTRAGRTAFCCAHGGRPSDLARRTKLGRMRAEGKGVVKDLWPYRHEDGVYEVLAQFCEAGYRVAPGWRARVTLADGKHIDPDGMVLVNTTWGKYWCYLEFELSDRSYSAIKPRCEKYASWDRRDDYPVLVVCHDDRAEENFHKSGSECTPRPKMLTTTLRRLRDARVTGTGVWSDYGVPITLVA